MSPSTLEAAAVLHFLPSLTAFGLPSPSAMLCQNLLPQQSLATDQQATTTTMYNNVMAMPSSGSSKRNKRGRPRYDRANLQCANCHTITSTQWRTSGLYETPSSGLSANCVSSGPRTLCNACGLREFRRRQRETRDIQQERPSAQTLVSLEKMTVSFLTN